MDNGKTNFLFLVMQICDSKRARRSTKLCLALFLMDLQPQTAALRADRTAQLFQQFISAIEDRAVIHAKLSGVFPRGEPVKV